MLVCSPQIAGRDDPEPAERWRELGFSHRPDLAVAQAQHDAFCRIATGWSRGDSPLRVGRPDFGCRLHARRFHPDRLWPDSDEPGQSQPGARSATPSGSLQRARNSHARRGKRPWYQRSRRYCVAGSKTLLVGRGYRANAAGIGRLRVLLQPRGVKVLSAPLPHGQGPSASLQRALLGQGAVGGARRERENEPASARTAGFEVCTFPGRKFASTAAVGPRA